MTPGEETYEKVRNAFAKSVSSGIIAGFREGGVKGALKAFAQSLQNAILDRASTALADALFGAKGSTSTGLIGSLFGSIVGFNKGGVVGNDGVHKFASGGIVPGIGNKDTVPALLTPGERVLTKDQQKGMGGTVVNFSQVINAPLGVSPEVAGFIAAETEKTIAGNPALIGAANATNARRNRTFGGR